MAELIADALPQYAPITRHYRLAGGQHVLVTAAVAEPPLPPALAVLSAVKVDKTEPSPVEVFLCDADARLIDADGDPANGMTPLLRLDPNTTFDEAVAAAEQELA